MNRAFISLVSSFAFGLLFVPRLASSSDAVSPAPAARVQVPDNLRQAIAQGPCRLASHRSRDEARKPAETMAFYGVKNGMKVAELIAADGYFSGVLAATVGNNGRVYAQNNKFIVDYLVKQNKIDTPLAPMLAQPGCNNIVEITAELDNPGLPLELDAVFMVMVYHDFKDQKWDSDAVNTLVFKSLKRGGVYGIIDHRSAPGTGVSDVGKNHRIEENVVISEVERAGFRLAEKSDLFANAKDPLNVSVFDKAVRDHTDRFSLKFVKP